MAEILSNKRNFNRIEETIMKKYYFKLLVFIITILFGVFLFIFCEYDDSPGGQLLGLIIFIIGIIGLVKNKKDK